MVNTLLTLSLSVRGSTKTIPEYVREDKRTIRTMIYKGYVYFDTYTFSKIFVFINIIGRKYSWHTVRGPIRKTHILNKIRTTVEILQFIIKIIVVKDPPLCLELLQFNERVIMDRLPMTVLLLHSEPDSLWSRVQEIVMRYDGKSFVK